MHDHGTTARECKSNNQPVGLLTKWHVSNVVTAY